MTSPAKFRGKAKAYAALASFVAKSTGPIVKSEARIYKLNAIKLPKSQTPNSSNEGVIRSTKFPNPFQSLQFCSSELRFVTWFFDIAEFLSSVDLILRISHIQLEYKSLRHSHG